MMTHTTDVHAASSSLAGGVSASLRLHPYLGRAFSLSRGEGPYIYDEQGNRYIDFNTSNGAAILGHAHPAIRDAVVRALDAGTITAGETSYHEQLAAELCDLIPSAERVRFASTGSEVTSVAIRLARHVTGRSKILKFDGHFHGLTDTFLFSRDPESHAVNPSSGGVPISGAGDVIMTPWNAFDEFRAVIDQNGSEIAAVIMEPVHYNAGCIPPEPGFLELTRELTEKHGIVLIFDEVQSGFRANLGGMETYFGVQPDLSTWAKALANGLPLSALTGRADLMEQLAPYGPVAHSGTYSGQLHSVLAALATLQKLRRPGIYDQLRETSTGFNHGLQEIFDRHGLPVRVQGLGARFGLYFGRTEPVRTVAELQNHDHAMNREFVLGCLERGVYFHAYSGTGPPGHAGFSLAHDDDVLGNTLESLDSVAAGIVSRRRLRA